MENRKSALIANLRRHGAKIKGNKVRKSDVTAFLAATSASADSKIVKDSGLRSLFDGADLRYILHNNDIGMVVTGKDGKDYSVTKLGEGMYEVKEVTSLKSAKN